MVTLQDISIQLMKPAKDLADWKFPLSQILEEYYALLEEPCNVNFGEAALVLQNSTNVYVRRIERLFTETEILKQTFFGYEEEEIKKSTCKEKKSFKTTYADFDNFVIIDLEKDVGKNINKKTRFETQKKVKLLSHRFTQLESNVAQLCVPIQMYDVLGEVIGKKYDFRCNQAVNTNGMLVDELTPYDFTCVFGSRVLKGRNSLSSCSEPKTPGTGTSGYHSAASPNDNESITSNHEEYEEENNFSLQLECTPLENESAVNEEENNFSLQLECTPLENESAVNEEENNFSLQLECTPLENESAVNEEENLTNRDDNISCINTSTSHQFTVEKNDLEGYIQNNSVQDLADINDLNFSTQNSETTDQIKERCQNENLGPKDKVEEKYQKSNKTTEECEANSYKQLNRISKEDQLQSEKLLTTKKKRNQTTKASICSVDDINEIDWKPMPFIQGVENCFSNNSSILKVPDYISLLERKFGKKRKLTSKIQKPECLTKFVLRESKSSTKKEEDFISEKKQKFKRLRRQELEDFMKNLDECMNNTERENNTFQYEPVTGVTIDLLGFRISQNQNDFIENNTEDVMSRNSSPIDIELQSTIHRDSSKSTKESPNIYNYWQEPTISEIDLTYSLPDYQTLIEDKMKEIFKESDVITKLDQTVAKWHTSLQQKLLEAEIRPTFRIHDYASRIMESLRTLNQKISFDDVVQDKPAYEVARYFLASLQLANSYSVEIKTEDSSNSIEITLLNNGKDCDRS